MWATAISTWCCSATATTPQEYARVKQVYARMIDRAIAMGGTCTGEHGIGSGKRDYLEKEHGPALAFMRVDQARARP